MLVVQGLIASFPSEVSRLSSQEAHEILETKLSALFAKAEEQKAQWLVLKAPTAEQGSVSEQAFVAAWLDEVRAKQRRSKRVLWPVLEKEGAGLFGNSKDTSVWMSVNVVRRIYGDNNKNTFPQIVVKPEKGVDEAEFKAVLTQKLRTKRGLKSDETSTFFVNQMQGFADFIDDITGSMNIIGLIISGFSLLVGGFGIANIMFVSVKERTNLIGIQKSLGAKNKFILFQFLFEAVILAVIGGLIGLFLVFIVSLLASQFTGDFEFVLSPWNMFVGTAISAAIGLVSGILPAISASKLDPVEAIRTGM